MAWLQPALYRRQVDPLPYASTLNRGAKTPEQDILSSEQLKLPDSKLMASL